MKYEVGVYLTSTSFNSVMVEADTKDDAVEFATEMYDNDEIELIADSKNQLDIMIESWN
jgi:hypothetical protein